MISLLASVEPRPSEPGLQEHPEHDKIWSPREDSPGVRPEPRGYLGLRGRRLDVEHLLPSAEGADRLAVGWSAGGLILFAMPHDGYPPLVPQLEPLLFGIALLSARGRPDSSGAVDLAA